MTVLSNLTQPHYYPEASLIPIHGAGGTTMYSTQRVFDAIAEIFLRPDDSANTVLRKRVLLAWQCVAVPVALFALTFIGEGLHTRLEVGCLLALLASLSAFCLLLAKRTPRDAFIIALFSTFIAAVLLIDLSTAEVSASRIWPVLIVILDASIVMNTAPHITAAFLVITLLWLALTHLEGAFRFGLFDLPGGYSQEQKKEALCGCETVPCGGYEWGWIGGWVLSVLAVVMNTMFFRAFAVELVVKQTRIDETVLAVQRVAACLTSCSTEEAVLVLEASEGTLPPQALTALTAIIRSVRAYKPFLPPSLYEDRTIKDRTMDVHFTPGCGQADPRVAFVFTDIKSSTALWDAIPDGMQEALKVHNTLTRSLITQFYGCEVKAIGDAFMVAFETAERALRFALTLQEALMDADWPKELLSHPQCATDGRLWGGLCVRMGAHIGRVALNVNAMTGRVDYYGQTVIKAARLEAVCVAGSVAASRALLDSAVSPSTDLEASEMDIVHSGAHNVNGTSYVCMQMGTMQLKGVEGEMELYALLPTALKGRRGYVEQQIAGRTQATLMGEAEVEQAPLHKRLLVHKAAVLSGGLEESEATAGRVNLDLASSPDVEASMNMLLHQLLVCLARTDGRFVSLCGASAYVGWNIINRCIPHIEGSFRFAALFQSSLQRIERGTASMGISTGMVLSGGVGTVRQRFLAGVGECVRQSELLSTAATQSDAFCLYTCNRQCAIQGLSRCLLPSDVVNIRFEGVDMQIYELSIPLVRQERALTIACLEVCRGADTEEEMSVSYTADL